MTAPRRLRSAGDAAIGVTRHPTAHDRMMGALTFTANGKHYTIDLTLDDVKNMFADLTTLLGANEQQVSQWWARLADGRDGRPRAKAATKAGGR